MNKSETKSKERHIDNEASSSYSDVWFAGVDEVGRGPLAGPVSVGIVAVRSSRGLDASSAIRNGTTEAVEALQNTYADLQKKIFQIVGKEYPIGVDSKKMKEKDRDFWYDVILKLVENEDMYAVVGSCTALEIDQRGIAVCIKSLIDSKLKEICETIIPAGSEVHALLDGGLKTDAPVASQQTIIKGDEKQIIISLASVFAKVTRDNYMKNLSKNPKFAGAYEKYGFDVHKGYGTLAHRAAIKEHGLSDEHRSSFCGNILNSQAFPIKVSPSEL